MLHGVFEIEGNLTECDFDAPALISEVAQRCGIRLNLACGGMGTCGRCAVKLVKGEFTDDQGNAVPSDSQLAPSCRTTVNSNFYIVVPPVSLIADSGKVLVNFENLPTWDNSCRITSEYIEMEPPSQADSLGDIDRITRALGLAGQVLLVSSSVLNQAHAACKEGGYKVTVTVAEKAGGTKRILRVCTKDKYRGDFGVAIDIGTTSVVCTLVDLSDGRIVDSVGSYNQQVRKCADVASRITAASTAEGLAELHKLIIDETLGPMFTTLCKRNSLDCGDLLKVSVAGNTIMTHLLLGLDPRGLGAVPFTPVVNAPASMRAGEIGLKANPDAEVIIAPAISGYVGGDISADMVACDITTGRGSILLVDIGTNAEIVACCGEKLMACAAPAGPAFEGQGATSSMRATAGAVDSIKIDPVTGKCDFTVIAGADPAGICGSGYIDFIAQAWKCGIINMVGRFENNKIADFSCEMTQVEAAPDRKVPAFKIVDDIVVTESDIAAILQAKGVIRAAIDTLLARLGVSPAELDSVYLAGGFARHLDLSNTLAIGMLPELDESKIEFIGNGSLAGAYLALMDSTKRKAMEQAAKAPEMIELNLDPAFQDAYAISMMLGL